MNESIVPASLKPITMGNLYTVSYFLIFSFSLILSTRGIGQAFSTIEKTRQLVHFLNGRNEPAEIDLISQRWNDFENFSLSRDYRTEKYRDLIYRLGRLSNLDTTGYSTYITAAARRIIRDTLSAFEPLYYPTHSGKHLPEVVKIGDGKIPVVLIPEFRKNWLIYKTFMETHGEDYTFYAITLPGYNNTLPYALPEAYTLSNRVWLEHVVQGVIDLIKSEHLEKPILVGTLNGGTYVATLVAARIPRLVRGVISLNGTLYEELEGVSENETDRNLQINGDIGNILSFLLPRKKLTEAEISKRLSNRLSRTHPIYHYTKDTLLVKEILRMHLSFPSITERYNEEWKTANLTSVVRSMKVPYHILIAEFDQDWPFAENPAPAQWQKFIKDSPRSNVKYSTVKDSRYLIVLDAPDSVRRHLDLLR